MFERPDFTNPEFAEHVAYFDAYKNAIVPLCRGRVLDIGAGHGYLSRAAAEQPEVSSVLATDRHYDPLRHEQHLKLAIIELATEDLIQQTFGMFDTIVATEHIEHLRESVHPPLLAWIRKHLNPGGAFLGSMPQVRNSGNPFHLREYLAGEWREFLRNNSFPKVEIWFPLESVYVWRAQ